MTTAATDGDRFLLESGKFSDVEICFVDEARRPVPPLRLHKAILLTRCAFFRSMFANEVSGGGAAYREANENVVHLVVGSNTNAQAMAHVLAFLYTGELPICGENVMALLAAAHQMQVTAAMEACQEFLWKGMTSTSVCTIIHAAHYFHLGSLLVIGLCFLCNHVEAVVASSADGRAAAEDGAALRVLLQQLMAGRSIARIGAETVRAAIAAIARILGTALTVESTCTVLRAAHLSGLDTLKLACLHFLCEHAEAVLRADGVVELPAEILRELLRGDDLAVEEARLREAVVRWGEANRGEETLEETIATMLPLLRTSKTSADTTSRGTCRSHEEAFRDDASSSESTPKRRRRGGGAHIVLEGLEEGAALHGLMGVYELVEEGGEAAASGRRVWRRAEGGRSAYLFFVARSVATWLGPSRAHHPAREGWAWEWLCPPGEWWVGPDPTVAGGRGCWLYSASVVGDDDRVAAQSPVATTVAWKALGPSGRGRPLPQLTARPCTTYEKQLLVRKDQLAAQAAGRLATHLMLTGAAAQRTGAAAQREHRGLMGAYVRVEGKTVGGRCVWRRQGGGRSALLFYMAPRGEWWVAPEGPLKERLYAMGNGTGSPSLRRVISVASDALTPDQATAPFVKRHARDDCPPLRARMSTENATQAIVSRDREAALEAGSVAPNVMLRVPPEEDATAAAPLHGKLGVFERVEGRVVGGRCVWHRLGGGADLYLYYAGTTGEWWVSTKANMVAGRPRGWFKVVSDALSPDRATAPWEHPHWRPRPSSNYKTIAWPSLQARWCSERAKRTAVEKDQADALAAGNESEHVVLLLEAEAAGGGSQLLRGEAQLRDWLGVYKREPGRWISGRCVWSRQGDGPEAYLYYARDGAWAVGNRASMMAGRLVARHDEGADGGATNRARLKRVGDARSPADKDFASWQIRTTSSGHAWSEWRSVPKLRAMGPPQFSALHTLDVSGMALRDRGLATLAERLVNHPRLVHLDISANQTRHAGARAIARVLPTMGALSKLIFGGGGDEDDEDDESITPEPATLEVGMTKADLSHKNLQAGGAIIVGTWISHKDNGALLFANLLNNRVGVEQSRNLARILKEHATLKSICGNKGNEAEMDMSGKEMGADGAIMLAPELVANGALTSLNLSENGLEGYDDDNNEWISDMSGVTALAAALPECRALTSLDMSNNNLNSKAHPHIADMLKVNTTLKALDYSGNDMSIASGAQAFADGLSANGALVKFDISKNKLSMEGGKAIAEALKGNSIMTDLNIASNDLSIKADRSDYDMSGVNAICEAISTMGALTSLNVSDNRIGYRYDMSGSKALAAAIPKALTHFDISNNCLWEEGTKTIAEALKGNSIITELNLAGSNMMEVVDIAETIPTMEALVKLDVSDNLLFAEACKAMAEALKNNQVMTDLNIASNFLGEDKNDLPDMTGVIAISDAILTMGALVRFDISKNKVRAGGVKALASALKDNNILQELTIADNQLGLKDDAKLWPDTDMSGVIALANAIRTMGALTSLDMSANKIGQLVAPPGWYIDEGCMKHPDGRKCVRYYTGCGEWPEGSMPEGVIAIAHAIPTMGALTKLNVSANQMEGSEAGKAFTSALAANTVLKELDLSGPPEAETSIGLARPGADAAFMKEFAVGLSTNRALTSLNLSNNKLGVAAGWCFVSDQWYLNENIPPGFSDSSPCRQLPVEGQDASGVIQIADAIRANGALKKLLMGNNRMASAAAGKALAAALAENTSLKELDVSSNVRPPDRAGGDGPGFAKEIAAGLRANGTLVSVNLLGNAIGVDQAQHLARLLKEHATLKSLCGGGRVAANTPEDTPEDTILCCASHD